MSGHEGAVNPADRPDSHTKQTLPPTTQGTLLGGRVSYRQFQNGYRTGLEPVLLAAFSSARPGQSILEAGCGAGAGLLCLATRVSSISGVGLEHDADTRLLAESNFNANHFAHLTAMRATLPSMPKALRQHAPMPNGRFHHSMANPPWHRHTATPAMEPKRRLALSAPAEGWSGWVSALTRWTEPGGTLSLAITAADVDIACVALLEAGCGSVVLYPLWPHAGRPPKIVLMRATVGGKGGFRLESGLVLHNADGSFTSAARAILEDGTPIIVK